MPGEVDHFTCLVDLGEEDHFTRLDRVVLIISMFCPPIRPSSRPPARPPALPLAGLPTRTPALLSALGNISGSLAVGHYG